MQGFRANGRFETSVSRQACSRRILRFCKIHEFSVTSSILRAEPRGLTANEIFIYQFLLPAGYQMAIHDNITQNNALLNRQLLIEVLK